MSELNVGSIVPFGSYNWRVLDVQDNAALIITENIIEQRPYHNSVGDVTWADCSLRKYLNDEFYNSFTEDEKSRIIPVLNKNQDNQWYRSQGGEDTRDYIFILSIEEVVCKYFGDSSKYLENRSAKQRYWFQKKDPNNHKRIAIFLDGIWWWWLRSPGRDNRRAVYIHGDGNIGIQGNVAFRFSGNTIHPLTRLNIGGIRPTLRLRLE
jgi:hypothetical protein